METQQLYTKKYPTLQLDEVANLYNKYRIVYETFSLGEIKTPKPLGFDQNTITFEYLELPRTNSLRVMLDASPLQELKRTYSTIGEKLRIIHKKILPFGYIHGDFWPDNIYVLPDSYIFMDWEFSLTRHDLKHLGAKRELDISTLIVKTITALNKRNILSAFLIRGVLVNAFLSSYRDSGGVYDADLLRFLIKKEVERHFRCIYADKYKRSKKTYIILVHLLVLRYQPFLKL